MKATTCHQWFLLQYKANGWYLRSRWSSDGRHATRSGPPWKRSIRGRNDRCKRQRYSMMYMYRNHRYMRILFIQPVRRYTRMWIAPAGSSYGKEGARDTHVT